MDPPARQDLRELGDARAGPEAVEGVEDLADRDKVALGFADGSSEGPILEGGGEVDEGAGRVVTGMFLWRVLSGLVVRWVRIPRCLLGVVSATVTSGKRPSQRTSP